MTLFADPRIANSGPRKIYVDWERGSNSADRDGFSRGQILLEIVAGGFDAWWEDNWPWAREAVPYNEHRRKGIIIGHAIAIAQAAQEMKGGGALVVVSGAAAALTGGGATPIAVPVAAAGTALAGHGALVGLGGVKGLLKVSMEGPPGGGGNSPPRTMPGPVYKTGKEAKAAAEANGWKEQT